MLTLLAAFSASCADETLPGGASYVPTVGGASEKEQADPDEAPNPLFGRRGLLQLSEVDAEVTLAFQGETQTETLTLTTTPRALDLLILLDTTSSFLGEIQALQDKLSTDIIPKLRDEISDVAIGLATFQDFPRNPYGREIAPADSPYELLNPITTELVAVQKSIDAIQELGQGGDTPESLAEAVYQVATGEGYQSGSTTFIAPRVPEEGRLGGVDFRPDVLHLVLIVTDAPSHQPEDYEPTFPNTRSLAQAAEALRALPAQIIGISSGKDARADLEFLADATESWVAPVDNTCLTGIRGEARPLRAGRCPAVYDIDAEGGDLADSFITAIKELLAQISYEKVVGTKKSDSLSFISEVRALEGSTEDGSSLRAADLEPAGDAINDSFVFVPNGAVLTYQISLDNALIPSQDYAQHFRVTVELRGDEIVLQQHRIRVTVPAIRR